MSKGWGGETRSGRELKEEAECDNWLVESLPPTPFPSHKLMIISEFHTKTCLRSNYRKKKKGKYIHAVNDVTTSGKNIPPDMITCRADQIYILTQGLSGSRQSLLACRSSVVGGNKKENQSSLGENPCLDGAVEVTQSFGGCKIKSPNTNKRERKWPAL